MQSIPSSIWTRVVVSISYDDNHYIRGTFYVYVYTNKIKVLNEEIIRKLRIKKKLVGFNQAEGNYLSLKIFGLLT